MSGGEGGTRSISCYLTRASASTPQQQLLQGSRKREVLSRPVSLLGSGLLIHSRPDIPEFEHKLQRESEGLPSLYY